MFARHPAHLPQDQVDALPAPRIPSAIGNAHDRTAWLGTRPERSAGGHPQPRPPSHAMLKLAMLPSELERDKPTDQDGRGVNGEIFCKLDGDSWSRFSVQVVTPQGSHLWLVGNAHRPPSRSGTNLLASNDALCVTAWAYGQTEYALSQCATSDNRKRLRRLSDRQAKQALTFAEVAESLTISSHKAWCSACLHFSTHRKADLHGLRTGTYMCGGCGALTTRCGVPKCKNMALRGKLALPGPRYCAEHRHDIPGFAKGNQRLESLLDYEALLAHDKLNAARITWTAAGTIAASAIVGPLSFFAAPLLGGALGASALGGGLSGAAATSHGLAMLGGGALAAGGLGMAGGGVVVTAAGTGLGGALGLSVVNAYASQDKSFAIRKLRDGSGSPVLLASGFLTENDDGWGKWRKIIDERYPEAPVYRVHWGAKDLAAVGVFVASTSSKFAIKQAAVALAVQASKKAVGPLGLLNLPVVVAELLANPWHVARARADMTGAILADLIARSPGRYILVGHSLGGAVMMSTAQTLGTRSGDPKLEAVHVLGAAIAAGKDWHPASRAVSQGIWNYYSTNDNVLSKAFTAAQGGQRAIGNIGMTPATTTQHDVNVSDIVGARHSDYTEHVQLERWP